MSDAAPPSLPPSPSLEERLRKLAADKSSLQLVVQMMNRLSALPGLDNTIESMLRAVGEAIGGVNLTLYYWIDEQLCSVDVSGVKRRLGAILDPLVQLAFETRAPVERAHPFRDTEMRTPEFSKAYTWAVPLLVGSELIGILHLESLHLAMGDLSAHLPTFFGYAALVLKNEILGYSRLQHVNRRLAQEARVREHAEEELRRANEALEERVAQRTADLQAVNAELRESERRLSDAERVARIGYWDRDLDAGRITMSEEAYRIFGLPPQERYQELSVWHERWVQLLHPDDKQFVFASLDAAAKGRGRYDATYRIVQPGGDVRVIHSVADAKLDQTGRMRRIFGIMQDITERKQAEDVLRRLNRELRAVSNCNQTLMRATDEQSLLEDVCRIICEDAGYRLAWVGFAENDGAKTVRPVACSGVDDGYLQGARITWADTDEGQRPPGTAIRTGQTVHVQDFRTFSGFEPWKESAVAHGYLSGIALPLKDDDGRVFGVLMLYSGEPDAFTPDEIRLQEELAGDLAFGITVLRGRLERQRAESALRESEERFRELAATIEEVFWISDPHHGKMLYISPGYEKIWGRSCESLLRHPSSWRDAVHPDDRERVDHSHEGLSPAGVFDEEYRVLRPNGDVRWVRARTFPVWNAAGELQRVAGVARDVTDRRVAQDEMRATNDRFARQETALMAVTRACAMRQSSTAELMKEVTRVAAETLEVERASVWGFTRDRQAIVCRSLFERSRGGHSDAAVIRTQEYPGYFDALSRGQVIAAHDALTDPRTREFAEIYLRPLGITSMLDTPVLVPGSMGGVFCCEHVGPARRWTADEQTFAIAVANVISLMLAEDERQVIEVQLRQSQKMEAIGQLAGGVAHDFNNILTAVTMQVELTGMIDGLPDEATEGLREIRASAERAANLTRQLLLFSRRQVMQPKSLDLNEVVTNLARMLLRIIGEDIRLKLDLHPTPLMVRADAGMLDQVLMNLSVNARDAMPGGGHLGIETSLVQLGEDIVLQHPDAAPGRYVCLCVSDTGTGIPKEVVPRIFEPFFSTKEPGKGTGLGLATVFGIVQQHRGVTTVQSDVGRGSSFRVFLPALEPRPTEASVARAPLAVKGGTECILLVEDEAAVRVLTRTILERRGYRVLEAATGAEALSIWREHQGEVALVVTDLVMPGGMTGQELGQKLQSEKASIKVIFMSGYSPEVAGRELHLRSGENFLQKPFGPGQLLSTVRRCLDG